MSDLNVIYRIAADISGLKSGVDRAAKATEGLGSMAAGVGKALTAAFTVGAILKLGNEVLDFAGNLADLSAQTGISTTGLQQFDLAFSAAGVTMETVAAASTKLANNLVGGDKSTVAALTKLGLSVKELLQLKPEDRLVKVGDAIGKIQDPAERAYAAMQLVGKDGVQLLKGLDGHLADTIAQFEKMGLIVDEDTIQAIDDFGDQIGVAGKQLLALTADVIGPLLPILGQLLNALMPIAKVLGETLGVAIKVVYTGFASLAIGIDLFLSGLLRGLQKLPFASKLFGDLSGAIAWLEADAKDADAKIKALWASTDQAAESATNATPPLIGLGDSMKEAEERAKALKKAQEEYAALLDDTVSTIANYERLLNQLGNTTYEGIAYDHARGISLEALAVIYDVTKAQVEQVIAVEKALAAQMDATTARIEASRAARSDAVAAVGQSLAGMPDVLRGMAQATGTLILDAKPIIGMVGTIATTYAAAEEAIAAAQTARLRATLPLNAETQRLIASMSEAGIAGEQMAAQLGMSLQDLASRLRASGMSAVDVARTLGISVAEAFGGGLKGSLASVLSGTNIGNLVVQSLTGGGGLTGAIKALGSQIGGSLTESLGKTIKDNFTGKLGQMLGGIIGPLGSLVGPLIGKVGGWFKNLFGGKEKETNKLREEFVQLGGGLDALNRKAHDAGTNLTSMLKAKTPEAYKKAIDELNAALQTQAQRSTDIASAGGLDTLAAKAQVAGTNLTAMLDARTPEAYKTAIDDLNAALAFQDSAMATLDETVQKYGFTIQELGPAFARQQLDKRAQELYQDFQVLAAAGVPVANIIKRMSGNINEFVQNAIKTGTEVPEAMRPMLQAMIDNGQLVDANGRKYESLEETGLSFSMTMTQGFEALIETVDRLTEAIARGLGLALDDLPEEVNTDVNVNVNTHHNSDTPETSPDQPLLPEYAASGGVVTTRGLRPVRWTPIGSDIVPTMLTPGEVVLTTAQTGQLAAALQQSAAALQSVAQPSAGPEHVELNLTLNIDGVFSEGDLVSTIQRRVVPIIHETWNANVAGTRTAARDVLGVP